MHFFSSVAGTLGRRTPVLPAPGAVYRWIVANREAFWIAAILLVCGLAHGINLLDFPYYESDEGTYMSQAWAITDLHTLAPYTYWYDHAPGGWLQLAAWTSLTGGYYTFGLPVASGRILIHLMRLASVFMVYRITRRIGGGPAAATIAALSYGLSAYGLYYGRRVLLDNMTIFWMLLSIVLLLERRLTLTLVWLSAFALGTAILTKELTIFLVPVLAYLVWYRTHGDHRWFAVIGWTILVGSIFSTYLLLALLKGEFFPYGSRLGGAEPHVSLIEALRVQTGREKDGGIFDLGSDFWEKLSFWQVEEPLLVYAGTACAALSVLIMPWKRLIGVMGLVTWSLVAFLGRGGVTLGFYLVPLLPLLAINLGLMVGLVGEGVYRLIRPRTMGHGPRPANRWWQSIVFRLSSFVRVFRRMLGRGMQATLACAAIAGIYGGYRSPYLQYENTWHILWTNDQAVVHEDVARWTHENLPAKSSIVLDMSMYLELHHTNPDQRFEDAHYYWKVARDPAIGEGVFNNDWRTIDYVITTHQLMGDVERNLDTYVFGDALAHSTQVAAFDTGGWPMEVRQVHQPFDPVRSSLMLSKSWQSYVERFIENGRVIDRSADGRTTSEGQSYALLRAVYSNDRKTFDEVWRWTRDNLQREDKLLSWHWGTRADGRQGIIDAGTATDGDQDTALALLFAAKRWNEPAYQQAAFEMIRSIWRYETMVVNGQRVIVAGDWVRDRSRGINPVINPSYFAPYAYRIFAEADPGRDWFSVVDSTYTILEQIRETPELGGEAGLVPNWLEIDRQTSELRLAPQFGAYAGEYSYDASRLPWRLAVDWLWFGERNGTKDLRPREALEGLTFLEDAYTRDGRIVASYRVDGTPTTDGESPSMYAGALGALMFSMDRDIPRQVYQEKLVETYTEDSNGAYWGDPDGYYDQNWAWFATALVNDRMVNLWEGKTSNFEEHFHERDALYEYQCAIGRRECE